MDKQLKEILATIERQSQRQDSVLEQLHDLEIFATRLGMYDAADVLDNLIAKHRFNGIVNNG